MAATIHPRTATRRTMYAVASHCALVGLVGDAAAVASGGWKPSDCHLRRDLPGVRPEQALPGPDNPGNPAATRRDAQRLAILSKFFAARTTCAWRTLC